MDHDADTAEGSAEGAAEGAEQVAQGECEEQKAELAVATAAHACGGFAAVPDPDIRHRATDLQHPGEHQGQTSTGSRSHSSSTTCEQWSKVPGYDFCLWHGDTLWKPKHFKWDCQTGTWQPGCFCQLSSADMEWFNSLSTPGTH